jgi:peptidoglycan/xylan/chitin deacetylase (PgdA/CDA1 family)
MADHDHHVRPSLSPDHPSVLITFDHGYQDRAGHATAVLDEFDVRMLLFLRH